MKTQLLLLAAVALTSGCAMIHRETHTISGGEAVTVEVEREWPNFTSWGVYMMPAWNEHVEVQQVVAAWPVDPPTNGIHYGFGLRWRDADLPTSVRVEDVTDARAVVLVNDPSPHLSNSYWGGVSAILPLNDPNLGWVQAREDAVRIYRFSVATRAGNQFQICQAVTYSYRYTAFMRHHFAKHPDQNIQPQ